MPAWMVGYCEGTKIVVEYATGQISKTVLIKDNLIVPPE
jgi:hypothetical protein